MSKRTWLILGVGLLLIAVAFFVFKWENKQEPEPEPEPDPIKNSAEQKPTVTPEQPIRDLTAQNNKAGDDEQLS